METFFACHTRQLDVDEHWIKRLWKERRIAVHYPELKDGSRHPVRDNDSTDPSDHPPGAARRVMNALNALAKDGGYVCAQYRGFEPCLLGKVLPGTDIEHLTAAWRRSSYDPPRPAALKTLTLEQTVELSPAKHALLLVGRPPHTTLSRWHKAGDTVRLLVEGEELPIGLDRLTPKQQEILCSEFLRLTAVEMMGLPRLTHLLLPPGGSFKDLDILGVATDGRLLCAQVTHSGLAAAAWKVKRLAHYADESGAHVLLFCRTPGITKVGSVLVCPIDDAFEVFRASEGGEAWLTRALHGSLKLALPL